MKIKEFKDVKQFDIVYSSNGFDIVLQKTEEYVMLAPYIMNKDLIDFESIKLVAPKKDKLYFSVHSNCVKQLGEGHYAINGQDIKIKKWSET